MSTTQSTSINLPFVTATAEVRSISEKP
ncbi:MAG: hypothetical protein R2710_03760 [Acidimicrobiales bacterium]